MKKFLRTAFVIIAGYGVYVNHKNDSMSDLANIKLWLDMNYQKLKLLCELGSPL